jgi:hypothetical protein
MFDRMAGNPIRVAAARQQSTNNLKQMGIGLHGLATRTEGLWPPAVGAWPGGQGPKSTIFFHILPDIEQINVYNQFQKDPTKIPDSIVIKTYVSPSDPSNDGKSALCSYASNGAIFATVDGGSCRYPAMFNAKGTSNTILFFEHYARPAANADGSTLSNYWYRRRPRSTRRRRASSPLTTRASITRSSTCPTTARTHGRTTPRRTGSLPTL